MSKYDGVSKEAYVAYDLVNNAVWVHKGGSKFGKTKRFGTQKEAYAEARKVAVKKKMPIYDTYYGKMRKARESKIAKRRPAARRKTSTMGFEGMW